MTGSVRAKALVRGGLVCDTGCDVGPIRENLSDFLSGFVSGITTVRGRTVMTARGEPYSAVGRRMTGGGRMGRPRWPDRNKSQSARCRKAAGACAHRPPFARLCYRWMSADSSLSLASCSRAWCPQKSSSPPVLRMART